MTTSHSAGDVTTHHGTHEHLRVLKLGASRKVRGFDLTPLLAPANGARDYLLLHEAIADIAIEEVSVAGQVNRISVHNRGAKPVLILEGQTVTGAKQNRMVAVTVLVPAGSKVELDVGCVERGRWSPRYGAFELGDMSASTLLRAQTVADSKHTGKVHQAKLWGSVDWLMGRHQVSSGTSDYYALLKKHQRRVGDDARALEPEPGQVGTIVLHRGRLVAFEMLGHDDAWRAMAQRLVGSYLVEAEILERMAAGRESARGVADDRDEAPASAADWLLSLVEARTTLHPAAGLGRRIALEGRGPRDEVLHGAGLWHGDRPLHLAVFAGQA